MSSDNYYDVTAWAQGDPIDDVGVVINSIIDDVKRRQSEIDLGDGGKPGAVIYIPPGDYRLRTQVIIDVSFIRICGSGHGFTSSSIRFNVPRDEWGRLHELWPGGSRIINDIPFDASEPESAGAAFLVKRDGGPRISSVEFADFCIDGLHFTGAGAANNPENSYKNGKTGIFVEDANDSFRVTGMGLVYLEHALTFCKSDALSIDGNFVAECGNCVELRGWGQASKVVNNLIGAGPAGHSIYAENHGGLLVTANNVFPRGASSVYLEGVTRSSVASNRLHSFYSGMVVLAGGSSENLVSANHLLRDGEPWAPFADVNNGLDDMFGTIRVSGSNNSVIGNHISQSIDSRKVKPEGATPIVIRLVEGGGNYVASNHVVSHDVNAEVSNSCFEAQVDALLSTETTSNLAVTTVFVDAASARNTILDSGTEDEVVMDRARNAFRSTPSFGSWRESAHTGER